MLWILTVEIPFIIVINIKTNKKLNENVFGF